MEIKFEQNLINNDKEYEIGLSQEENSFNHIMEEPPQIYNPIIFNSNIIINYFKKPRLFTIE
mgnify:CR=1 FL=1